MSYLYQNDTIAAIATGMTQAGIGIIRISGPDAFVVADKVFRAKSGRKASEYASHTLHLGFIIGEELADDIPDRIFSEFCMGK